MDQPVIVSGDLIDARPLRLFWACDHEPYHRHIGTGHGACSLCKATWCTVRPYDCELAHYPRRIRRQ